MKMACLDTATTRDWQRSEELTLANRFQIHRFRYCIEVRLSSIRAYIGPENLDWRGLQFVFDNIVQHTSSFQEEVIAAR